MLSINKNFDEIHILYNHYINTISFKLKILKIMSINQFKKRFNKLSIYDVSEPDENVSLPHYYEIYVAS